MTRFSIVIPVYNVEQYLRECVSSVLSQEYKDFEVVLVDDGSKDHSGEICDEFADADNRVKVIHKPNGGPTSARTEGTNAATGEYLVFLDSDDYFAEGLLSEMSKIVDEYDPDAILYDGVPFPQQGQEPFQRLPEPGLYSGDSMEALRKNVIFNEKGEISISYGMCSKVFRRTLYLPYQSAVPTSLYKGEDLAVTAPLLVSCSSVYVSDFCGYYYRDTPNSIMHRFSEEEIDQITQVSAYLQDKMPSDYGERIDAYLLSHYFDYLDRAMLVVDGYRGYREVVRRTMDASLAEGLKRARTPSANRNEKLVFFLLRNKLFGLLWVLRHIKPRRE